MILKEFNDRFFFFNEKCENVKYKKFINKKKQDRELKYNTLNVDIDNFDLDAASVTGKYIVNMISGECTNCNIQYSITDNSIVWICPVCNSLILNTKCKIKILNESIDNISLEIEKSSIEIL